MDTRRFSRVLTLAIVAGVAVLAVPSLAQTPGQFTHTSSTGVFSAMLPAGYEAMPAEPMDQPTPMGIMRATNYQAMNMAASVVVLQFTHAEAPPGFEAGRTTDMILQDFLNGMTSAMGAVLITQRPAVYGAGQGVEADFTLYAEGATMHGRVRVFLFGNEIAALAFIGGDMANPAVGNPAVLEDGNGNAFLNSFTYTAAP